MKWKNRIHNFWEPLEMSLICLRPKDIQFTVINNREWVKGCIGSRNLPAVFVEPRLLRGLPLCPLHDLLSANGETPALTSTRREHSRWSWQTKTEGNGEGDNGCYRVVKYTWQWREKQQNAVNSQKRPRWAQLHTDTRLKLIRGESAQFSVPSAVWRPGNATERLVHLFTDIQTHVCPAVIH